jgi:hypothetical protein
VPCGDSGERWRSAHVRSRARFSKNCSTSASSASSSF